MGDKTDRENENPLVGEKKRFLRQTGGLLDTDRVNDRRGEAKAGQGE